MTCVQMAEAVADKAEAVVAFRLIVVGTNCARDALGDKALELRTALLTWVTETWAKDNLATVNMSVPALLVLECTHSALLTLYSWCLLFMPHPPLCSSLVPVERVHFELSSPSWHVPVGLAQSNMCQAVTRTPICAVQLMCGPVWLCLGCRFEEIVAHLHETPETTEAMDELEKYVMAIEERLDEYNAHIVESKRVGAMLHGAQHELSDEDDSLFWIMCHWPLQLNSELEDARTRLTRFRTRYMSQLKTDQATLVQDIADLRAEVDKFVTLGDLKQVDDRLTMVLDLESRLAKMAELAELYQGREAIFGLSPTDYPQIELIQKTFDPYAQLWRICSEFTRCLSEWMDGPFTEIDSDVMPAEVGCCTLMDT